MATISLQAIRVVLARKRAEVATLEEVRERVLVPRLEMMVLLRID